jgi:hypothetical protein
VCGHDSAQLVLEQMTREDVEEEDRLKALKIALLTDKATTARGTAGKDELFDQQKRRNWEKE